MQNQRPPYRKLFALLVFACIFVFLGLGEAKLIDWDENIYAEASRQMVLRGDYLNVFINDQAFTEKPPFFFWELSASYHLFGINEFSARFPSGIAAILMIGLFFFIGGRISSYRVGLLWGVVYLTSLLPSSFARAAVIDHTFNLFIAAATFSLYLYDVSRRDHLSSTNIPSLIPVHLRYLTAAALCMGLAVLTKGPLGGVIPLVAFGGYKLFYRTPGIHPGHFLFCGVLSLSIASSWYIANWVVYGTSFLEGFWQFQTALFSKSLEGHAGPFYYHFVIVFLGLIPWTPFLFSGKPGAFFTVNPHYRPLFVVGTVWVVFVLILFSFVATKLPHYSASVYLPLSFFIAVILEQKIRFDTVFPRYLIVTYSVLGIGLAVLLMFVPKLMERYAAGRGVEFSYDWSIGVYIAGVALILVVLLGAALFWLGKNRAGILITALMMLIFTQDLWRFHLPPFLHYTQQPLLDMVDECHQKKQNVVFYRLVSFAALFYGKQPIEMLHTYKFSGNPEILNHRHKKDVCVMSDRSNQKRLLREHPLVEHVENRGTFSLFVLKKTPGLP